MLRSEAQLKEAQARHQALTGGNTSVSSGDKVPSDITIENAFDILLERVWKGTRSEKTVSSHVRTL